MRTYRALSSADVEATGVCLSVAIFRKRFDFFLFLRETGSVTANCFKERNKSKCSTILIVFLFLFFFFSELFFSVNGACFFVKTASAEPRFKLAHYCFGSA